MNVFRVCSRRQRPYFLDGPIVKSEIVVKTRIAGEKLKIEAKKKQNKRKEERRKDRGKEMKDMKR